MESTMKKLKSNQKMRILDNIKYSKSIFEYLE